MKNLKNISKALFALSIIFAILFIAGFSVMAQTEGEDRGLLNYVPLAPLPGIGEGVGPAGPDGTVPPEPVDITTYAQGMFRLAIGLAAALAVIMITVGGVEYIGSDTITSKESGKNRIQQALMGLFLVMGAWLILYTVNPKLVSLDFLVEPLPAIITPEVEVQPVTNIYKIKTCYTNSTGEGGRRYTHLKTYSDRQYGSIHAAIRACNAAWPPSGIAIPKDTSQCTRIVYSCDRNIPEGYVDTSGGAPTIPGYYVAIDYRRLSDGSPFNAVFGPREQSVCEARASESLSTFPPPAGMETISVRCIKY